MIKWACIAVLLLGTFGAHAQPKKIVDGIERPLTQKELDDFAKDRAEQPRPPPAKTSDERIKALEDAVRGLGGNLPPQAGGGGKP